MCICLHFCKLPILYIRPSLLRSESFRSSRSSLSMVLESQKPVDSTLQALHREFINGCHVLSLTGVLDALGHLSVRHPHKDGIYIMSRNMAPATVSKVSDLVEYRVSDAEPLDKEAPRGFRERFIHAEIYKAYPSINAVIHSHADHVVPYTMNGVPLRACYHMGGILGTGAPVWDIAPLYKPGELREMLVVTQEQGASLARQFSKPASDGLHSVVLMRGHGMTVVGTSIVYTVIKAIYTMRNAAIQTAAITARAAMYSGIAGIAAPDMHYLDEEECEGSEAMLLEVCHRPWDLYIRELEANTLYVNEA